MGVLAEGLGRLLCNRKVTGSIPRPGMLSHPSPALPDDYTMFTFKLLPPKHLIREVILGGKTGKSGKPKTL